LLFAVLGIAKAGLHNCQNDNEWPQAPPVTITSTNSLARLICVTEANLLDQCSSICNVLTVVAARSQPTLKLPLA